MGELNPAEVVRAYLAAFETGDPEQVAAHVAEDFENEHASALGDDCVGRATYRERLGRFLADFAPVHYEVAEVIADGARVAAAYTMSAAWQGVPFELPGIMRFEVDDGLISRRVDYWDSASFLVQVDPEAAEALARFGVVARGTP